MAEHQTLYIKKYLLDCSCKIIFINVIVNCLDIKNYKGKKEKEKKIPQRTTPRAMPKAWQLNLVSKKGSYLYILRKRLTK